MSEDSEQQGNSGLVTTCFILNFAKNMVISPKKKKKNLTLTKKVKMMYLLIGLVMYHFTVNMCINTLSITEECVILSTDNNLMKSFFLNNEKQTVSNLK